MQRLLLALFLLLVTAGVSGYLAAQTAPLFPDDANTPFVEYRLEMGQIGHADNTQWVRVYPDGRGLAHYPAFTKRAGTYEFRMTQSEVSDLAGYLVEKGVLAFDPAGARQHKREIDRRKVEAARSAESPADDTPLLGRVHDAPVTTIIVRLGVTEAPAGQSVQAGVLHEREISWYALDWHAEHYPGIDSLGRLAEAGARLRGLFKRTDLLAIE